MTDLGDEIDDAFRFNGMTVLHVFKTKDGSFNATAAAPGQANHVLVNDKDPIEALEKAIAKWNKSGNLI